MSKQQKLDNVLINYKIKEILLRINKMSCGRVIKWIKVCSLTFVFVKFDFTFYGGASKKITITATIVIITTTSNIYLNEGK